MNLVDWLKGLAERPAEGADKASAVRAAASSVRPPRRGGESYAKEWVKVLDESGPGHDPFNTYTWELNPDAPPAPASAPPKRARKAPAKPVAPDPFDTYTWELQDGDTPEDPWGLDKAKAEAAPKKDGKNPYDTGVFDASWTGKFDKL